MKHYKIQSEIGSGSFISSTQVSLDNDANYETFKLGLGARLSRDETEVKLVGQGANCQLGGAYLNRGLQHYDTTTSVQHCVPNTTLRELFKGVLEDESKAVFQGKIVVQKDAQKTDAQMTTKTLLLSEGAEVNSKPELEIYADDVKCAHGAASGQLDEKALFYLRSRGVPEPLAKNMMVQSFLQESVDMITNQLIKDKIADQILHSLPANCYLSDEWRRG